MEIYKRLSNTITVLFSVLFIFVCFTDFINIPKDLRFIPFILYVSFFGLIIIINYIFLGYFAAWHTDIGKEDISKINALKEEHSFKLSFYTGFHENNIYKHGILNFLRGFIFIACLVLIFSIYFYILDIFGIEKFIIEVFGYNPNKYPSAPEYMLWINFSYSLDFVFLYLTGLCLRFNNATSVFGWIDSYEKKIHTPYIKKFKTFKDNYQYDSWFLDEDDWLDDDDENF